MAPGEQAAGDTFCLLVGTRERLAGVAGRGDRNYDWAMGGRFWKRWVEWDKLPPLLAGCLRTLFFFFLGLYFFFKMRRKEIADAQNLQRRLPRRRLQVT